MRRAGATAYRPPMKSLRLLQFQSRPTHVLGLGTEDTKLGVYSKWVPLISHIIRPSVELEFYDYSAERGRLELDNRALHRDPRAHAQYLRLVNRILSQEMQARHSVTARSSKW